MSAVSAGSRRVIDIGSFINEQRFNGFMLNMIVWVFLAVFVDGMDYGALSYAAPAILKEWHLQPSAMGSVFSIGIFGIMVGALLFGYIGGRLGRKRSLIIGLVWFGVFTLAVLAVHTVTGLAVVRFLAGVGLGGVEPAAIVLVSEYAPKAWKTRLVIYMWTGFVFGSMLGGVIASALIPRFGWHSLFWVGGILAFAIAVGVALLLPESIRYLVNKPGGQVQAARLAARMRPDLHIAEDVEFVDEEEKHNSRFSWKLLFLGALAVITPLLWLFYILNSVANYFLSSWLPTLFTHAGMTISQAALASSLSQFGGIVGGLVAGWILDRYGMWVSGVMPLFGAVIIALLGVHMPVGVLLAFIFFNGFFVVGTQFILTAITPMFYPTAVRSDADGAAIAIAKIGSISGPLIGGFLLSAHAPISHIFAEMAIPVLLACVVAFMLTAYYRRSQHTSDAAAGPRQHSA